MLDCNQFAEVWLLDVAAAAPAACAAHVRGLVAHELHSGRRLAMPGDALTSVPPITFGARTLCVAYSATVALACFEWMGWPLPQQLVDLQVEFRLQVNGNYSGTYSLPHALMHFGLRPRCLVEESDRNESVRRSELAGRDVRDQVIAYGVANVADLSVLFEAMKGSIDLPGALLRGRSVYDASRIEQVGVPFDHELFARFEAERELIVRELIARAEAPNVFRNGRIDRVLLSMELEKRFPNGPRTETGRISTNDHSVTELAKTDPSLSRLRTAVKKINRLRHPFEAIVVNGRSVTPLVPFGARTGRFAPSSKTFIFSAPEWMRGFIKPPPGRSVAYLDWTAQEMGIAAALSGDSNLLEAYASDDFYLGVARLAGANVDEASPEECRELRRVYKVAAIAMLYGMGSRTLASKTGLPLGDASALLAKHHEIFPQFWEWAERRVNHALLTRSMTSAIGWTISLPSDCELHDTQALSGGGRRTTLRTLRNFCMQANAADMMRLACGFAHDVGIRICAPVHDGLLIEAPSPEIDQAVIGMRHAMDRASRVVLAGYTLKTTVEPPTHYPNHFPAGSHESQLMWDFVRARLESP